jgi:integrase
MVAERASLLSGRDDEFVATVLMGYTGMRWGEVVGLETEHLRGHRLRGEWQLYELDTGEFHRCPPKDESRRWIGLPDLSVDDRCRRARTAPLINSGGCHRLLITGSTRAPGWSCAARWGS